MDHNGFDELSNVSNYISNRPHDIQLDCNSVIGPDWLVT